VNVLGIETSCDETAAAVVGAESRILSSVVRKQVDLHRAFGGVVPEIAARSHLETILPTIEQAVADAGLGLRDLEGIAVTNRPGLLGALLVGITAAKALAWSLRIPLVGVDHIEAHIDSARLANPSLPYPLVTLVASGGHTSLFHSTAPTEHRLLGATTDDAVGEAFDKVASLLGLGYPGGPAIEREASRGDPSRFPLKRPRAAKESLDFSFSGLKTAVLYLCQGPNTKKGRAPLRPGIRVQDVAAAFQGSAVSMLVDRTMRAARRTGVRALAIGGGVASNGALRAALERRCAEEGLSLHLPPPELCTDNAAMIAGLGRLLLLRGDRDGFDLEPYPSLRRAPYARPRSTAARSSPS
jgi:N6-L-threonylcarbamoyladenine synthase